MAEAGQEGLILTESAIRGLPPGSSSGASPTPTPSHPGLASSAQA